MHTSLNEAAYAPGTFPPVSVPDADSYDAAKYGYRVVTPLATKTKATATRQANRFSTLSISNSDKGTTTRCEYGGNDDFNEYHASHDAPAYHPFPESLDILSSPEILEILESQREWDCNLRMGDSSGSERGAQEESLQDDPYFSDCEAMESSWESNDTSEALNVNKM
jgi:hypothetical protein